MTKAALLVAVALAPCAAYVVPASRPALQSAARSLAPSAARADGVVRMNEREEGVRAGLVTEVPFEVRFSIGNLITVSGALLLLYCLLSYLLNNGEATLGQTLGFVYALPALLGGLALKYAELPPVPLDTSAAAEALRESKGTKTQNKILSDATRFTYGDAHMEEPLKALKLAPSGMGPPTLTAMREAVTADGNYEMGMTFFSPNTPYRVWKDRAPRFSRFFGPNVRAELRKVDSKKRLVELTLITCAEVRARTRHPRARRRPPPAMACQNSQPGPPHIRTRPATHSYRPLLVLASGLWPSHVPRDDHTWPHIAHARGRHPPRRGARSVRAPSPPAAAHPPTRAHAHVRPHAHTRTPPARAPPAASSSPLALGVRAAGCG